MYACGVASEGDEQGCDGGAGWEYQVLGLSGGGCGMGLGCGQQLDQGAGGLVGSRSGCWLYKVR